MASHNWIDEKIFWLTTVFAVDNDLFFSNFNVTSEIYKFFESGRTEDIQKAVDFISEKLSFTAPIAQYDWSEEIDDDIEKRGMMTQGKIVLSLMNTADKYTQAATTVHELMHYALILRKNINLPDELENEKITDLAALVLGFGKIVLNGKVVKGGVGRRGGVLGKLTLDETSHAFKKINQLRNINDTDFLTEEALDILNSKISGEIDYDEGEVEPAYTEEIVRRFSRVSLYNISFKNIIEKIKKLFKKYKKKKCPFCSKMISIDKDYCGYCKRQFKEKIK